MESDMANAARFDHVHAANVAHDEVMAQQLQDRFKRANDAFKNVSVSTYEKDKNGLDIAYSQPDGIYVPRHGNTMYIAGTRASFSDFADDALIPFSLTKHGSRYAAAKARLTPAITHVVGHSLGGSVSLELARNHPHLTTEVYGTPVVSGETSTKRHRHTGDLISIFDTGATTSSSSSWNPHAY